MVLRARERRSEAASRRKPRKTERLFVCAGRGRLRGRPVRAPERSPTGVSGPHRELSGQRQERRKGYRADAEQDDRFARPELAHGEDRSHCRSRLAGVATKGPFSAAGEGSPIGGPSIKRRSGGRMRASAHSSRHHAHRSSGSRAVGRSAPAAVPVDELRPEGHFRADADLQRIRVHGWQRLAATGVERCARRNEELRSHRVRSGRSDGIRVVALDCREYSRVDDDARGRREWRRRRRCRRERSKRGPTSASLGTAVRVRPQATSRITTSSRCMR